MSLNKFFPRVRESGTLEKRILEENVKSTKVPAIAHKKPILEIGPPQICTISRIIFLTHVTEFVMETCQNALLKKIQNPTLKYLRSK